MSESENNNSIEPIKDGVNDMQSEVAESEQVSEEGARDRAELAPEKPRAKKSLKVNFIFNLFNQVLTLILPLITVPYIARVLHEEGVGQYSYAASIITYFTLFANLGFDIYGQRQIARYHDDIEKKSKIFWEIFVIRTIFTLIATGILYGILFSVGFGESYNKIILICSITVVLSPLDIQFFYRGEENFRSLSIRNIATKLVMIALIFIFVKDESDLWIYVLCSVGLTVVSNIVLWLSLFKKIKKVKLSQLSLKQHIKPTIIIFLPTLITTIYTTFDKTMIGLLAKNPDYENGCYEQAYKINSLAQSLITTMSTVMFSRNASDFQSGNNEAFNNHIYTMAHYVWLISCLLTAGFFALSNNFSSWFLGEGYTEVSLLLCIMSVRLLTSGFSVFLGDRFIVMGYEKAWAISVGVGAAVNVLINYFLIPIYGAIGAAIATAATELMIMIVMTLLTAFKYKFGLSVKRIYLICWKYLLAAGASFVVMFFMQKALSYSVWEFILIGGVGSITYIILLILFRDKFLLGLLLQIKNRISKKKIIASNVNETVDQDCKMVVNNNDGENENSNDGTE